MFINQGVHHAQVIRIACPAVSDAEQKARVRLPVEGPADTMEPVLVVDALQKRRTGQRITRGTVIEIQRDQVAIHLVQRAETDRVIDSIGAIKVRISECLTRTYGLPAAK